MFCTQCGTQVPDDARFCPDCGQAMGDASAAPAPSPAPKVGEGVDAQASPPAPVMGDGGEGSAPSPMPGMYLAPPTPRKRPRWMTLAIAVVVLAGALVGGYFLLGAFAFNTGMVKAGDFFPNQPGLKWQYKVVDAPKGMPAPDKIELTIAKCLREGVVRNTTVQVQGGAGIDAEKTAITIGATGDTVTVDRIFLGEPPFIKFDTPMPIIKTPFQHGQKWKWKGNLIIDNSFGSAPENIPTTADITNISVPVDINGKTYQAIHVAMKLTVTITSSYSGTTQTVNLENSLDVVPHYGIVRYSFRQPDSRDDNKSHVCLLTPQFTYRPLFGYQLPSKPMQGFAFSRDTRGNRTSSINNLRQLAIAAQMYAQDNDEMFPPVTTFEEIKTRINVDAKVCQSPVTGQPYAWNRHLAGEALGRITSPATTIIFYDSVDMPNGGRCAAYVDGHVTALTKAEWEQVRNQVE